jgi:putative endonuclease
MRDGRSELGRRGENFASRYLQKIGWRIIERNNRKKWGELDIVAVAPDKVLVFVEVKTVVGPGIEAEEQMTKSKIEKFTRAARVYAGAHEELIDDKKGWRLDVIALTKNWGNGFDVKHYENI